VVAVKAVAVAAARVGADAARATLAAGPVPRAILLAVAAVTLLPESKQANYEPHNKTWGFPIHLVDPLCGDYQQ